MINKIIRTVLLVLIRAKRKEFNFQIKSRAKKDWKENYTWCKFWYIDIRQKNNKELLTYLINPKNRANAKHM